MSLRRSNSRPWRFLINPPSCSSLAGNTVTNALKYGIIINQDYTNEGATGKPSKYALITISLLSCSCSRVFARFSTVPIKNVIFSGTNTVTVGPKGKQVYVLFVSSLTKCLPGCGSDTSERSCGSTTCSGDWNWSGLKTS